MAPTPGGRGEPLWIVGASVRAAAQSARRAGFDVRAADLFADRDTRVAADVVRIDPYPDALRGVLTDAPPAPWMYTGALENHAELVGELAAARPLWGNGAETLRQVRDPWLVGAALTEAGFACPRLRRGEDPPSSDAAQWLRKPLRSAGGHAVRWAGRLEGASAEAYFQEFVPGTACSMTYVAAAGSARLWMIGEQLIGVGWAGGRDFCYCGSIGPLRVSERLLFDAARMGVVLARRFGLRGVFGVDAVLDATGPRWRPLEVNPRYTASVELWERVAGRSAVELHGLACTSGRLEGAAHDGLPRGAVAGKAILYARHDVAFDRRRADRIAAWDAAPRGGYRLADLPCLDDDARPLTVRAGRPIVTLLAASGDREGVLRSLQRGAAELETWLYG